MSLNLNLISRVFPAVIVVVVKAFIFLFQFPFQVSLNFQSIFKENPETENERNMFLSKFRQTLAFGFVVSLGFLFLVVCGRGQQSESKFPKFGRLMRSEFLFDPHSDFIHLNHGAWGTYPKHVQKALHAFQARAEANVDLWILSDAREEVDKVTKLLAHLINAEDSEDVVAIPNVTSGLNAILRSILFNVGDQILYLSTAHKSVLRLIRYITNLNQGTLTSLQFNVTYPISNEQLLVKFETFIDQNHWKEKPIRLAVVDHISAKPAVVHPIHKIIPMLKRRNITVLIDGAHGIGQVPLNMKTLAPDFYVTDLHKWLYTPRGCGLMYVDKKIQPAIHPAYMNFNNYATPARFQEEFLWTGTIDRSSYLAVTAALEFRQKIGGEEVIRNYTHGLAMEGGKYLAQRFNTSVLQEEEQMGNMVDVRLPIKNPGAFSQTLSFDFWTDALLDNYNLFAPTYFHGGHFYARFSVQIYNDLDDFREAADTFLDICSQINDHEIDNDNTKHNSKSIFIVNRLNKNLNQ